MSDWDSRPLVIGSKRHTKKQPKLEPRLTGIREFKSSQHPHSPPHTSTQPNGKKLTAGSNKAHQGTDHQRLAKLDRENEVVPLANLGRAVPKAIQDGRKALNMTQQELARRINEKTSVIQDYESGKAIPSPQILAKIERVLGIKLRGNDIGAKLEFKKKSA